jgi:hypothetical protein
MESKSKRDLNEFYGLHETNSPSSDGNRREVTTHHAKTRSLLPNSPYGLVNMSQKEMNTLGVTTTPEIHGNEIPRHTHTPQKQPTATAGNQSLSLHSQTTTRPHTSGAVFGKSFSEPIPNGVPPNIHFVRVQQSSGPLIIPVSPLPPPPVLSSLTCSQVPNQSDADPSLEGLSDEIYPSVIETWSRPQSKAERSNLYVEAIPLQFLSTLDSPQKSTEGATAGGGGTREVKRSTSPSGSAYSNQIQSASSPPKKPKVPPRRQVASSPSPPTIPLTATELPPRSPIKKSHPEKYFESPKISKRSLSYEHLQKERKIQNRLSSLKSNASNLSSPSTPQKVSLFLSEKVALNSPESREGNKRTGPAAVAAAGRVSRGVGRSHEEFYSSLTSRSQEILNSLCSDQD